jgi:hypothetical protein
MPRKAGDYKSLSPNKSRPALAQLIGGSSKITLKSYQSANSDCVPHLTKIRPERELAQIPIKVGLTDMDMGAVHRFLE